MDTIYESRPFKVRNADEYDLSTVLDLFVDPTESLYSPFDYENAIIKGRMGTGKTMYLRANHAFYLYNIVPSLLNKTPLILPIYVKLSDFQHINDPMEIYKAIIIRIIREMVSVYSHILDAKKMEQIHNGIIGLPTSTLKIDHKLRSTYEELLKLSSEEYTEKIKSELGLGAKLKNQFFEVSADTKKAIEIELKNKTIPSIADVEIVFNKLIEGYGGKIILLLDEAGSLNRSFFNEDNGQCLFEVLMNQLRTMSYIRTKIAIYPHHFSDILTETRYGDIYALEEDINSDRGYENFYHRAIILIERYLSLAVGRECDFEELFESCGDDGEALEQLIYSSKGVMRRLVQLLDQTMICAYDKNKGKGKISYQHAIDALAKNGKSMESLFGAPDKEFLSTIVKACRNRQAYKFKFPNKAGALYKYTSKSSEANVINVVEVGTGRRSTTYEFDYAFCVYIGLATHFIKNTEKIDKTRSRRTGEWIQRVTTLSDELIEHLNFPGKIEGEISWIKDDKGFVKDDNGNEYFWRSSDIIESDRSKRLIHGKRVRFFPLQWDDLKAVTDMEIL